jgi:hypothetical protein
MGNTHPPPLGIYLLLTSQMESVVVRSGKRYFNYRARFMGFPGITFVRMTRYRNTIGRNIWK